jgi:hypothetical protein
MSLSTKSLVVVFALAFLLLSGCSGGGGNNGDGGGDPDGDGGICDPGAEGCECIPEGGCELGLVCVNDICVAANCDVNEELVVGPPPACTEIACKYGFRPQGRPVAMYERVGTKLSKYYRVGAEDSGSIFDYEGRAEVVGAEERLAGDYNRADEETRYPLLMKDCVHRCDDCPLACGVGYSVSREYGNVPNRHDFRVVVDDSNVAYVATPIEFEEDQIGREESESILMKVSVNQDIPVVDVALPNLVDVDDIRISEVSYDVDGNPVIDKVSIQRDMDYDGFWIDDLLLVEGPTAARGKTLVVAGRLFYRETDDSGQVLSKYSTYYEFESIPVLIGLSPVDGTVRWKVRLTDPVFDRDHGHTLYTPHVILKPDGKFFVYIRNEHVKNDPSPHSGGPVDPERIPFREFEFPEDSDEWLDVSEYTPPDFYAGPYAQPVYHFQPNLDLCGEEYFPRWFAVDKRARLWTMGYTLYDPADNCNTQQTPQRWEIRVFSPDYVPVLRLNVHEDFFERRSFVLDTEIDSSGGEHYVVRVTGDAPPPGCLDYMLHYHKGAFEFVDSDDDPERCPAKYKQVCGAAVEEGDPEQVLDIMCPCTNCITRNCPLDLDWPKTMFQYLFTDDGGVLSWDYTREMEIPEDADDDFTAVAFDGHGRMITSSSILDVTQSDPAKQVVWKSTFVGGGCSPYYMDGSDVVLVEDTASALEEPRFVLGAGDMWIGQTWPNPSFFSRTETDETSAKLAAVVRPDGTLLMRNSQKGGFKMYLMLPVDEFEPFPYRPGDLDFPVGGEPFPQLAPCPDVLDCDPLTLGVAQFTLDSNPSLDVPTFNGNITRHWVTCSDPECPTSDTLLEWEEGRRHVSTMVQDCSGFGSGIVVKCLTSEMVKRGEDKYTCPQWEEYYYPGIMNHPSGQGMRTEKAIDLLTLKPNLYLPADPVCGLHSIGGQPLPLRGVVVSNEPE